MTRLKELPKQIAELLMQEPIDWPAVEKKYEEWKRENDSEKNKR